MKKANIPSEIEDLPPMVESVKRIWKSVTGSARTILLGSGITLAGATLIIGGLKLNADAISTCESENTIDIEPATCSGSTLAGVIATTGIATMLVGGMVIKVGKDSIDREGYFHKGPER